MGNLDKVFVIMAQIALVCAIIFSINGLAERIEQVSKNTWTQYHYLYRMAEEHKCVDHNNKASCDWLNVRQELTKLQPQYQWSPGHVPKATQ